MTTFQDGPAQGKTLMLRRCPFFLRVVTKRGEIDALDQIGDTPSPAESIHVYLRQPGAAMNAIHLNTGRKPGGGWFARADYKLSPVQPPERWRNAMPRLAKALHKTKPRVERMRARLDAIRARRAGKPKCPSWAMP